MLHLTLHIAKTRAGCFSPLSARICSATACPGTAGLGATVSVRYLRGYAVLHAARRWLEQNDRRFSPLSARICSATYLEGAAWAAVELFQSAICADMQCYSITRVPPAPSFAVSVRYLRGYAVLPLALHVDGRLEVSVRYLRGYAVLRSTASIGSGLNRSFSPLSARICSATLRSR